MKYLMLIPLLAGCSVLPDRLDLEAEHISHPAVGWPVSPSSDEDGLSQVQVIARWQSGPLYMQHGLGYNLQGRDGGGFYGPGLTYTGRIGVQLWGNTK